MRKVSDEFKRMLNDKNRHLLYWADITLLDGTVLNLDRTDLMQGDGFKIADATSGTSSFDIGSVIVNQLSLKLNNEDDVYSTYDFEGATVVAYTGFELEDGSTEKLRMGTYVVDEAKAVGITIILTCPDNIRKFDKVYSISSLKYPASLETILKDACKCCGVTLISQEFENGDFVVENRPDDESLTFREVVQWIAQISCKYVRCDAYGKVFLGWYDEQHYYKEYVLTDELGNKILTDDDNPIIIFAKQTSEPGMLSGGEFDGNTPFSSGDTADGGTFSPWNKVLPDETGGMFDTMNTYHHIWMLNSLNIGIDDVEITGVNVALETDSGEGTSYLYGDDGYVLVIERNGLIQSVTDANNVAMMAGKKVIGMKFRTFDAGHLSDPIIEAGDTAYVTDRKHRSYRTYITNTTYSAGATQKSSCGAETPEKKKTTRFSDVTKAIVGSKKAAAAQIGSYNESMQALTGLMTNAFGAYKTEEKQPDGSTVFYMHDKPNLSESMTIWKRTIDAFAVSTDGGKTWNAGLDKDGNAIFNILSVVGIRFDWARGGMLTLGGLNNEAGIQIMLNEKGEEIGRWDNKQLFTVGPIVSDAKETYNRAVMNDGKFLVYDKSGNACGKFTSWIAKGSDGVISDYGCGIAAYESTTDGSSDNSYMYVMKNGKSARINGKRVYLTADTLYVGNAGKNGSAAKSGRATFSDGSYMDYKNGILVGGRTASGSTF